MSLCMAYDGYSDLEWPIFVADSFAELDRHFGFRPGGAKQAARQETRIKGMYIVRIVLDNDLVDDVA